MLYPFHCVRVKATISLDNAYLDVKISEWIRPEFTCGWS